MQTRVRLVLVRYNALAAGTSAYGVPDGDRLGLRDGAIFRSKFNVICPVQSRAQKYSAFLTPQISGYFRASRLDKRGVSRSSRTRGGMWWTRQRRRGRWMQGEVNS